MKKKNAGLLFSAREKIVNNFRNKTFPTKNYDKIPATELTPELATETTLETAVFDTPKPSEKQINKLFNDFFDKITKDETI